MYSLVVIHKLCDQSFLKFSNVLFIKVDDVEEFVNKVNKIKFSDGDTTGPRSIPKNELIRKIESAIKN